MVKTSLEFGQVLEQEVSQRIADLIPKLVASITGGPNQIINGHIQSLFLFNFLGGCNLSHDQILQYLILKFTT